MPDSVTRLTSLWDLALDENDLKGTFPDLSGVSLLETLDLSHNRFEGSLPSLFDVNDLFQQGLALLESQSNISLLDIFLDASQLIGFGRKHTNVKFSHNHFSGEMPIDHWLGSTLREYRIDNNHINGSFSIDFLAELPSYFWPHLANLTIADFDQTSQSPSGIIHEMEVIDISTNQFTGHLPDYVHLFPDFVYVNVSFNRFSSSIPAGIGNWEEVRTIDLSYNKLHGTIPRRCLSCVSHRTFIFALFS